MTDRRIQSLQNILNDPLPVNITSEDATYELTKLLECLSITNQDHRNEAMERQSSDDPKRTDYLEDNDIDRAYIDNDVSPAKRQRGDPIPVINDLPLLLSSPEIKDHPKRFIHSRNITELKNGDVACIQSTKKGQRNYPSTEIRQEWRPEEHEKTRYMQVSLMQWDGKEIHQSLAIVPNDAVVNESDQIVTERCSTKWDEKINSLYYEINDNDYENGRKEYLMKLVRLSSKVKAKGKTKRKISKEMVTKVTPNNNNDNEKQKLYKLRFTVCTLNPCRPLTKPTFSTIIQEQNVIIQFYRFVPSALRLDGNETIDVVFSRGDLTHGIRIFVNGERLDDNKIRKQGSTFIIPSVAQQKHGQEDLLIKVEKYDVYQSVMNTKDEYAVLIEGRIRYEQPQSQ
ncbi:unnamed protein product, partial [Didymodactylos carnosus]